MVLSPADFKNILFLIAFETWTPSQGARLAVLKGKCLETYFNQSENLMARFCFVKSPFRSVKSQFRFVKKILKPFLTLVFKIKIVLAVDIFYCTVLALPHR